MTRSTYRIVISLDGEKFIISHMAFANGELVHTVRQPSIEGTVLELTGYLVASRNQPAPITITETALAAMTDRTKGGLGNLALKQILEQV